MEATTNATLPSPGTEIKSSTDTAFTLFYGKFRAQAPRVAKIMKSIEDRILNFKSDLESPGHVFLRQEYESVLTDCQNSYFACRRQLLLPSVKSAVSELSNKYTRDHCGLVRAGCAFLLHVCEDEYQLFQQFFGQDFETLT